MALQWKDQLSVGNEVIDSDHKALIEIINETKRNIEDRKKKAVFNSLDSLQQYLKRHSAAEEAIACALSYSDMTRLHERHQELIASLDKVVHELKDKLTPASLEKFDAFVQSWLITDVIQGNIPLKPLLAKHSPLYDPR